MTVRLRAEGIDVSDNNGVIPWTAWAGHLDFVFIKATEGLFWNPAEGRWDVNGSGGMLIDPQFHRNWDWAKELGLIRIAYHFAHPGANPAKQAQEFLNVVHDAGFAQNDGISGDIEVTDGMPPIEVSFWASVFTHVCRKNATGQRFFTYTYPYFAEQGNVAKQGDTSLWIADYGVPEPYVPRVWPHGWEFWQYAPGAKDASGIRSVDRDVFNGNARELAKFMKR